MEGQFCIPIQRFDGVKMNMEVRQRNANRKKRKVKTWTSDQDEQLMKLYQEYPKKWAVIASLMTERNQNQCLHRYRRLSQLGAHRKIWSPEEDQTIKKIMKKVGKNWKVLSEMLGSKTGKQIRERFINKLDPKIKKEDWSDEQDRKIIELYSEIGRKWSQISKHLPGRPENKIKNRFYSYIQKNYDIKYKVMEEEVIKPASRVELQDLSQNMVIPLTKLCSFEGLKLESKRSINESKRFINEVKVQEKYDENYFPSIHHIDLDMRMEDFPINQQNLRNSKMCIRSLLKVDEEWGIMSTNARYRNLEDFEANQEMHHDLFYPQE